MNDFKPQHIPEEDLTRSAPFLSIWCNTAQQSIPGRRIMNTDLKGITGLVKNVGLDARRSINRSTENDAGKVLLPPVFQAGVISILRD
jgi:hypothetical protein